MHAKRAVTSSFVVLAPVPPPPRESRVAAMLRRLWGRAVGVAANAERHAAPHGAVPRRPHHAALDHGGAAGHGHGRVRRFVGVVPSSMHAARESSPASLALVGARIVRAPPKNPSPAASWLLLSTSPATQRSAVHLTRSGLRVRHNLRTREPRATQTEWFATGVGLFIGMFTLVYFDAYGHDRVVVTDRERLMSIPPWLEASVGNNMERKILSSSTASTTDNDDDEAHRDAPDANNTTPPPRRIATSNEGDEPLLDPAKSPLARSVVEMATMLIRTAEAEILKGDLSKGGPYNWRVLVVDAPMVNAFCAPGGLLVVYTGLIAFAARAQLEGAIKSAVDNIAMVLAHEVAHALARHGAEKMSWLPLQLPFLILALNAEVLIEPFELIYKLPHSRQLESEADTIGILLMAMTGFDPRLGIDMFPLIPSRSLQDWTSTHPGGAARFHALEGHMSSALEAHAHRLNNLDRSSYRADVLGVWLKELPHLHAGSILKSKEVGKMLHGSSPFTREVEEPT